MKHNICEELVDSAIAIDDLEPWQANPHRGDIPAIKASYKEFGQMKPVVVRDNGDRTYTIVAGNHQVEAARQLGWTHIAATKFQGTMKQAIAFALADNRTTQLGTDDPVLLHEAVISVVDEYPEMFDSMGWDDFQRAAMEEQVEHFYAADEEPAGYVPPVLISRPGEGIHEVSSLQASTEKEITAPVGVNTEDAVRRAQKPLFSTHWFLTMRNSSVGGMTFCVGCVAMGPRMEKQPQKDFCIFLTLMLISK